MKNKKIILLVMFASLLGMPSLSSAWSSDTSINTPISLAVNDQSNQAIASDGSGGAYIAWTDYRDPDDRDIYAQYVDSTGAVQWATDGIVICDAPDRQNNIKVTNNPFSGAYIAWVDKRSGQEAIYVSGIRSDGDLEWGASHANGLLVSATPADIPYLSTISDDAGGVILVWLDVRSGNPEVYGQRIDNDSVLRWAAGGQLISSSLGTNTSHPAITADGSGGAIISWTNSTGANDVYAQRINATGTEQWASGGVAVVADTVAAEYSRNIVSDGAGGAIVLFSITGDAYYVQKINADGLTQWPAPVWYSTGGDMASGEKPVFIEDGAGGALMNWQRTNAIIDNNILDVFVQGVDTNGALRWATDGLFIAAKAYKSYGAPTTMINDGAGGFIMAWTSFDSSNTGDVLAQHYNVAGLPTWGFDPVSVSTNPATQKWPVAVTDNAGGAIFVWQDQRNGEQDDLYAHKFTEDGGSGGLQTPVNQLPVNDAAVDALPALTGSEFVDFTGAVSHAASQWRVNNINTITPETPVHNISGDDSFFTYDLPFTFPFYERNIVAVSVNTNGLIELLEAGETSYEGSDYDTHNVGDHIGNMDAIFAANDDLDMSDGYLRLYNAGTQVVIEWHGTTYEHTSVFTNPMLFQVIMHDDGRIIWNFNDLTINLFSEDLFSGIYPNGGIEIDMYDSGLINLPTPAAFEFNPVTRAINTSIYNWFAPQAVIYDSAEITDLISHQVPANAGIADAVSYYWGVRYKGDNDEWSLWSAPTRFTVDLLAPTVETTDPDTDVIDVAINTAVRATFSEDMDASTIHTNNFTLTGPSGSVTGTVSYDNRVASFTPVADLQYNALYTSTISATVMDASGKSMAAPYNWSFTTGAVADTSPPSVVITSPAVSETDVAIDIGSISVTFNESLNETTINSNSFTLTGPTGSVAGVQSYDVATMTARIVPDAVLAYSTVYTVAITSEIEDNAGNAFAANYSWTFSTADAPPPPPLEDTVPPQVVSHTPSASPVPASIIAVTVTFSEAVQNIDTSSFTVSDTQGPIQGTVQYDAAAMTAWFYPSAQLDFLTQYTIRISASLTRDLAGNNMAIDFVGFFVTGTDPALEGCDPELGQQAGCINFDYFTYGTGIDLATYECCVTGFTGEDAARRSVDFEQAVSEGLVENANIESEAEARVDSNEFRLRARSRRLEDSTEDSGAWSIGASKIDVNGVPPGSVIPMSIVVSGSFTRGHLMLQVRDFDDYRMLGSASGGAESEITYSQTIDVYGNNNDIDNIHRTTSTSNTGIRVDFDYPVVPNNGIYVWFVAGAYLYEQGSINEVDLTAQLEIIPPPGVTVTLASGQVFTGPVDSDGDGVADVDDSSINDATTASPVSATGSGQVQIDASTNAGVTLSQITPLDDDDASINQTDKPVNQSFPDGLISFRLNGLAPGAQALIHLTFPTAFPANAKYYKVSETGFYEFSGASFSLDRRTVTLTITDGGIGDNDGIANGVIEDPGGVAVPVAVAVAASSNDSDGFLGLGSLNFMMLLAMFMIPAFNSYYLHRKNRLRVQQG